MFLMLHCPWHLPSLVFHVQSGSQKWKGLLPRRVGCTVSAFQAWKYLTTPTLLWERPQRTQCLLRAALGLPSGLALFSPLIFLILSSGSLKLRSSHQAPFYLQGSHEGKAEVGFTSCENSWINSPHIDPRFCHFFFPVVEIVYMT